MLAMSMLEEPLHKRALEAQAELIDWMDTPKAVDFFDGFFNHPSPDQEYNAQLHHFTEQATTAYPGMIRVDDGDMTVGKATGLDGEELHLFVNVGLRVSPTYAVTAEIQDLLEQAAPSMPGFELHEEDLPGPAGFIFLENGMEVFDFRGDCMLVRAISWQPTMSPDGKRKGIMCCFWTDPYDPRDSMIDRLNQTGGDPEATMTYMRSTGAKLVLGHFAPMFIGSDLTHLFDLVRDTSGKEASETSEGMIRFTLALFRFTQEKWVDDSPERPDRAARRRASRSGVKTSNDGVKVIRLRRSKSSDNDRSEPTGESGRVYSRRWFVSGHWRNQWYPSIQAHRPKYIPTYLKGPEDAPLIVRDTVFQIDR